VLPEDVGHLGPTLPDHAFAVASIVRRRSFDAAVSWSLFVATWR